MKNGLLLFALFILVSYSCKNSAVHVDEEVIESDVRETVIEVKDSSASSQLAGAEDSLEEKISAPSRELVESVSQMEMEIFDPDYINGRWEAEDQNGYSFGAWFDSENGIVFGQYCAMNHDASRVDCGAPEELEFCYLRSGQIKGKESLNLEVVSCYSEKKGRATIAPQEDGNLVWRLIEEPGKFEVDHFAPKVALLRKVSFDPYE